MNMNAVVVGGANVENVEIRASIYAPHFERLLHAFFTAQNCKTKSNSRTHSLRACRKKYPQHTITITISTHAFVSNAAHAKIIITNTGILCV